MMALDYEEVMLALALPLLLVVAQGAHSASRQIYAYAKSRCVARIAAMMAMSEEPSEEEIYSLRIRFTRSIILDAVTYVSEHIYGSAVGRLLLIVEVCEVDYSPLCNSRLRETAALMEAYPDKALLYISRLDIPLSWHEVALLTQLMRRAGSPIAYTPLLLSQNRNLQLVGLYLCQHFSIVDAEPHLQRLVQAESEEVAYVALLSLCSIRGDLSTPQVGYALGQLSPPRRTLFIRHAVNACYSLSVCAKLLTREEKRLFVQRLNSYKCQIVCN